MNVIKRFAEWFFLKEKLNLNNSTPPLFKEGEVWWCGVGENVGVEVNGKNHDFSRPVVILRKLSRFGFIGIPLSTKLRTGTWYVSLKYNHEEVVANLSQVRFFSSKRIYNKLVTLEEKDFSKLKQAFISLF